MPACARRASSPTGRWHGAGGIDAGADAGGGTPSKMPCLVPIGGARRGFAGDGARLQSSRLARGSRSPSNAGEGAAAPRRGAPTRFTTSTPDAHAARALCGAARSRIRARALSPRARSARSRADRLRLTALDASAPAGPRRAVMVQLAARGGGARDLSITASGEDTSRARCREARRGDGATRRARTLFSRAGSGGGGGGRATSRSRRAQTRRLNSAATRRASVRRSFATAARGGTIARDGTAPRARARCVVAGRAERDGARASPAAAPVGTARGAAREPRDGSALLARTSAAAVTARSSSCSSCATRGGAQLTRTATIELMPTRRRILEGSEPRTLGTLLADRGGQIPTPRTTSVVGEKRHRSRACAPTPPTATHSLAVRPAGRRTTDVGTRGCDLRVSNDFRRRRRSAEMLGDGSAAHRGKTGGGAIESAWRLRSLRAVHAVGCFGGGAPHGLATRTHVADPAGGGGDASPRRVGEPDAFVVRWRCATSANGRYLYASRRQPSIQKTDFAAPSLWLLADSARASAPAR